MNYDPIHDTYTATGTASISATGTGEPTRVPQTSEAHASHFLPQPDTPSFPQKNLENGTTHLQSNLHHLLSSSHNVDDSAVGPDNGQKPQNAPASDAGPSTHLTDDAAKCAKNTALNTTLNGAANATAPNAAHPPQKDAKFSINNLVDTNTTTKNDFSTNEASPKVPLGSLPPDFRSVSSGFKHLKKADGEPFWRRDIQHDFLAELFSNEMQVFTNRFPPCELPNAANGPKLTFAELYVRTLAESAKSSRVLRERLISDPEMAIAVSKVSLLVNTGRMNTTINFVPDMRSALRTYHSIPSLQADPAGGIRQLQDTPRLKTILKAVCDEDDRRSTLLDILRDPLVPADKPNTNVIKLIFLMSTFFQNIPFHYYVTGGAENAADSAVGTATGAQNKFMEFFLNDKMHPKSRARRFLWLMYTYLETSFQPAELAANPFHPHTIPPPEFLSPDEMVLFDNDTDFEVEYATKMYHARMLHLDEDVKTPKIASKKHIKKLLAAYNREQGLTENESGEDSDDGNGDGIGDGKDDAKGGTNPDRVKRKKPTASVGALVDYNKRVTNYQSKWKNPHFPAVRPREARTRFVPYTTGIAVRPLDKNSPLSIAHRQNVAKRSKLIVAYMADSVESYNKKRKEITRWMYRYFQYKKNSGNGLLALEWEDIRSDLVNGIEGYLYQQLGKQIAKSKAGELLDDDKTENLDADSTKQDSVSTAYLTGDAMPVEISDIETFGTRYLPSHDFNKAGERTTYELSLLQYMEVALSRHVGTKTKRKYEAMHFDLESETLSFNKASSGLDPV